MKRTKAQREEHLNQIAKMYVRGTTQMEMSRQLGVSQGQISNDLRLVLNQWTEQRIHDIDRIKNEQLTRINEIEREMWEAWEASKTKKKVVVNKSKSGEMMDAFDPMTGKASKVQTDKYWRAGTTEEEPVAGDKQYMDGVMWCVQERSKIVGLYAPKKVAQTDPTGEHEAMSAKEILGDIISGILKGAEPEDKDIVEGELMELDGENDIPVDAEGIPELAKMLREKHVPKRLNPAVQYDFDGNIIAEVTKTDE